jgi:acyl-CoA thioester hydrolase
LFRTRIHPRFCDTDALGHIGNTVVPVWLLEGREALLKLFVPDLDFRKASLVVVRSEIDFLGELHFGADVEVTTALEKIGNSSLVVLQDVIQNDAVRCRARTVMVNFDAQARVSQPIPDAVRKQLEEHLAAA